MNQLLEKPYLNEKEVAEVTGRAISTIRNDRFMRKGLPYLKIGGRSIRYKTEDVISYMEGRRITFNEV
jgi:predicted DNA-binding transcriptional regulator AlpA